MGRRPRRPARRAGSSTPSSPTTPTDGAGTEQRSAARRRRRRRRHRAAPARPRRPRHERRRLCSSRTCTSASATCTPSPASTSPSRPGSTLGVLGHNGAGKTTLIRVLTTLIRPDRRPGARRRLRRRRRRRPGPSPDRRDRPVRRPRRVPHRPREPRARRPACSALRPRRSWPGRRPDRLRLDLGDIADRRVGTLSGGSRRRIDLAVSLVGAPSVLFLDEPTTGLDPVARSRCGTSSASSPTPVRPSCSPPNTSKRPTGSPTTSSCSTTVRVAARGTPAELKRLVGGKVVTATVADRPPRPDLATSRRDEAGHRPA